MMETGFAWTVGENQYLLKTSLDDELVLTTWYPGRIGAKIVFNNEREQQAALKYLLKKGNGPEMMTYWLETYSNEDGGPYGVRGRSFPWGIVQHVLLEETLEEIRCEKQAEEDKQELEKLTKKLGLVEKDISLLKRMFGGGK